MSTTSTRSEYRLRAYLNSWGTTLPRDIDKYRSTREMERFCLFCSHPHDSIGVIRFDSYQTHARSEMTDAHMCDRCAVSVIQMEGNFEGSSLRSERFSAKDEGFMTDRLNMFVEEYRFDSTVHHHYCDRDDDFYEHAHRCYFCKSDLEHSLGLKLEVPMDADSFIIGGRVRVCHTCARKAKLKRAVNGLGVFSDSLSTMHAAKLRYDTCARCHSAYPITLAEFSYRQGNVTHGRHLCPDCAFHQLYKSEPDPLVLPAYPGTEFMQRHLYLNCNYCDSEVAIDTTLPKKELLKKYTTRERKRVCEKCRSFGDYPLFSYRGENCRIRAYKVADNRFRVVKTTITDRFLADWIYHGTAFMLYYETTEEHRRQKETL